MDAITNQIVQQLDSLPIGKKKALLKLLKSEWSNSTVNGKSFYKNWKKQLLTTSVWTDAEIKAISKAREFINQWKPQQFS